MDEVVAASHAAITKGSKSFGAAAMLFDRTTRESAYMLYAWCRYCDDLIDGQELGFTTAASLAIQSSPLQRLDQLRADTDRALDGAALTDATFIAFQRVIQRHAIPRRYPQDLLQGFAMDVANYEYQSLDDTLLYCYHVAGVVGVMMAMVMGARDRDTLDRACDLGIAFQMTNIARDVIDDARIGRVYLPEQWLAQAGIAPDALLNAQARQPLAQVTARLLTEGERYYASARIGLSRLPVRSAWAIAAALRIYRAIGMGVRVRADTAWNERVRVNGPRKLGFALLAGGDALRSRFGASDSSSPPRTDLWTRTA